MVRNPCESEVGFAAHPAFGPDLVLTRGGLPRFENLCVVLREETTEFF